MNRHALRMMLREVAILVTALAFIVSGGLTMRQHVAAAAFAAPTGVAGAICHGLSDAATPGAPAKKPAVHVCDQCVTCQSALVFAMLPAVTIVRDWQTAHPALAVLAPRQPGRASLPYARGPPLPA